MANYTINYACGHGEDRHLYGKINHRESYIAWAASSGVCQDCRANNEAARIDAMEAELCLSPLTGSDKQIAWARKIRHAKIGEIAAHVGSLRPAPDKEAAFAEQRDMLMTALASVGAAKFWIDNRDCGSQKLMQMAAKQ